MAGKWARRMERNFKSKAEAKDWAFETRLSRQMQAGPRSLYMARVRQDAGGYWVATLYEDVEYADSLRRSETEPFRVSF